MKLKISTRLGLVAEKGKTLNIQAKKEENLYPFQGLRVKSVGRHNVVKSRKVLKCYLDE